jgi:hypothetical protein
VDENVTPQRRTARDDLTPEPRPITGPWVPPPAASPGEVRAELAKARWLYRAIQVETPEESFLFEYNGWGLGYETVSVNGQAASRETGVFWFAPRFKFFVGDRLAVVRVRVWPWLTLRSLELFIDGWCVYAEGV